jgi:hypothetical protein
MTRGTRTVVLSSVALAGATAAVCALVTAVIAGHAYRAGRRWHHGERS